MSTSEQRVRVRKTRQPGDLATGQGMKPSRRPSLKDIPRTWTCEGQMDLFDPREGEQS